MKNHSASRMSAESCISAAFTDFSPGEIIATTEQDRSAAAEPKTERVKYGFIRPNISAHQLDCRANLADQAEAGEMLRKARTNEKIFRPRRTVGRRFGPLLYWLAAFFVVAGPVLGASQADLQPALTRFSQEGSKLVGTFAVGLGEQGWSVALSADGNTAIVGGLADNRITGAAWVYTRSNGVWTQQSKLAGTGAVGSAGQGWSVALSDDSNTAIVGGPFDNWNTGAAWVYTRSNGVWTQQGNKLVGSGAVGSARQGASIALSDDGNSAIVGGPFDNWNTGAAWVYTRNGGVWTQLDNKLVGAGAVGDAGQGASVALSADGTTAIVGGPVDNSNTGAAWVYTRSGGVWTQLDNKLVGAGAVGNARQGASVALSADGSTAIVGGPLETTRTLGRRGSTRAAGLAGGPSWSASARLETPDKASPSHCPPTAAPPSWAALKTNRTAGRRGSTAAAGPSGPSRPISWSAQTRLEVPDKATPSRCPPTVRPPLSAGSPTTGSGGRRGSTAAAVFQPLLKLNFIRTAAPRPH
jgi:lipocalin